jgi:hypothetical protein
VFLCGQVQKSGQAGDPNKKIEPLRKRKGSAFLFVRSQDRQRRRATTDQAPFARPVLAGVPEKKPTFTPLRAVVEALPNHISLEKFPSPGSDREI